MSYQQIWLIAALGYGTHGLLDACTTYGTLLLWPFSDARIAWNTISVVDPLFTLPLLFFVIRAAIKNSAVAARWGAAWVAFYLTLGAIQEERAAAAGASLAKSRGHVNATVSAKPSFGNLLLWKPCTSTRAGFGSMPFEQAVLSASLRERASSASTSRSIIPGSIQAHSKQGISSDSAGSQITICRG